MLKYFNYSRDVFLLYIMFFTYIIGTLLMILNS